MINMGNRYFIFLNAKNSGFNTEKGLSELFGDRIRIYPMSVSEASLGDPEAHKAVHLLVADSTDVSPLKKALHVCPYHGCEYGSLLEYGEEQGKEFEKKLRESKP